MENERIIANDYQKPQIILTITLKNSYLNHNFKKINKFIIKCN